MDINDLIQKYDMKPHEENGCYMECHYPFAGDGRAESGSSYFFTPPGETTLFHQIDCDEYWCYNAGSSLEVWVVNRNGQLEIKKLGVESTAEPMLFFPKGVIFGSKNTEIDGEGTFFTCITVPRFSYSGFRLVNKDEVIRICPEAQAFWN